MKEMKFRNKLVEYLTDWIMGNSHQLNVQGDICAISRSVVIPLPPLNTLDSYATSNPSNRDLHITSMEPVLALLAGLSIPITPTPISPLPPPIET